MFRQSQLARWFHGIRLPVQSGGQDGAHGPEGAGVVFDGSLRRGLDSLRLIMLAQTDDAHAGAIALLRIGTGRHDLFHQLGRGGAGLARPLDEARRTPLGISLVLRRHVLPQRSVRAPDIGPGVGGHPLALVESLHRGGGQPDVESLPQQPEGHAVVVVVHLDVIVDVDRRLEPFGIFVGFRW